MLTQRLLFLSLFVLMQWDWLSVLHCLLSEVATTAAWFVSFWYWVGLVAIAGADFRINGGTIMAHAGNFVLALVVLLLTRLPVVSTHFQVGSYPCSRACLSPCLTLLCRCASPW
jgi:hypothetical protein